MSQLIKIFCVEEFGDVVNNFSDEDLTSLIKPMTILLHSHRYNRGEAFTEGLDFEIIRNLIYSYSQEARERFFSDPMMAFIFSHFC